MYANAGSERWRGLAPIAAAVLLLLGLSALRFLFEADEEHSWFLGRTFGSACWFRAHFGVPCPNCGMTRSLILAAHGEFTRSVSIAAGGAAMVPAAALASVMLGILGVTMLSGRAAASRKMQTALRTATLAAACLTAGVWFGAWAVAVARSLRPG